MKTNTKSSDSEERLRSGGIAAVQSDEMQLRRAFVAAVNEDKGPAKPKTPTA